MALLVFSNEAPEGIRVEAAFSFPASSFLSPGVPRVCPDGFSQSKAFPGVLGVLDELKEAKAPEPSPKALDAPEVGEAVVFVFRGEIALKGLFLPSDPPSPLPNLLAAEKFRVGWSPLLS